MPRSISLSVVSALALGCLISLRIVWSYYNAGRPMLRGVMYAALIAGLIFTSAISLFNKSQTGYFLLIAAAVLPALGSFALAVHLVTLVVLQPASDQIGLITSFIGLLQFLTILLLLVSLIRKDSRAWMKSTERESDQLSQLDFS